jgi:hypothetical protein
MHGEYEPSARNDMTQLIDVLDAFLPFLPNLKFISVTFATPVSSFQHQRLLDYTENRGIVYDRDSNPRDLFDYSSLI